MLRLIILCIVIYYGGQYVQGLGQVATMMSKELKTTHATLNCADVMRMQREGL